MFASDQDDSAPDEAATSKQVSLKELFYVTTLVALWFGFFQFLSPWLATIPASILIVVAAIRWFGGHNPIVSGLVGFASAMLVCCGIISLGLDKDVAIFVVLFGPCFAYVLGAAMANLRYGEF